MSRGFSLPGKTKTEQIFNCFKHLVKYLGVSDRLAVYPFLPPIFSLHLILFCRSSPLHLIVEFSLSFPPWTYHTGYIYFSVVLSSENLEILIFRTFSRTFSLMIIPSQMGVQICFAPLSMGYKPLLTVTSFPIYVPSFSLHPPRQGRRSRKPIGIHLDFL
jgi:hypothetical protein